MKSISPRRVLIAMLVGAVLSGGCLPQRLHTFDDVTGPDTVSELLSYPDTEIAEFAQGTESRLAVLVTDEDSYWLSLAHGLKSRGIPFVMTTDYQRALKHKTVFVYPAISGRLLSEPALQAIALYPKQGGTLIASSVLGGGLNGVFGFDDVVETKDHSVVTFSQSDALFAEPFWDEVRDVKIGSATDQTSNIGMNAYLEPEFPPLATYEDGSSAITIKRYGEGKAIAIGPDLGQLFSRGYSSRQTDISEHYVNHFQPTIDVFLEIIKTSYRRADPTHLTLGTVPSGKSLSVMMTHDVDYAQSLINALDYAEFEYENDVPATYFIQTKYIRDFNDEIFFNDQGAEIVRRLSDMDMELASHSVSHSLLFDEFDLGTGEEVYPDYQPFVRTENRTEEASIFGELRASKFLLEYFSDPKKPQIVTSFRPGYLRNPHSLPEAMEATGYKYSSSVAANNVLTHLPYRLKEQRQYSAQTGIFEFPVTIEDEKLPKLGDRLDEALQVANSIERMGGLFVVLIHTDILGHKLDFEKRLVEKLKDRAWFGTVSQFGQWWGARDAVEIDVADAGDLLRVTVNAPKPLENLILEIPVTHQLAGTSSQNANFVQRDGEILIRSAQGVLNLTLERQN